jgi:hypothetical protein
MGRAVGVLMTSFRHWEVPGGRESQPGGDLELKGTSAFPLPTPGPYRRAFGSSVGGKQARRQTSRKANQGMIDKGGGQRW